MRTGTIAAVAVFILLSLVLPAIAEAQHSANPATGVSPQVNNSSAVAGRTSPGVYGTGFGPGGYGYYGVGGVGGPAFPAGTSGQGNLTGNTTGGGSAPGTASR